MIYRNLSRIQLGAPERYRKTKLSSEPGRKHGFERSDFYQFFGLLIICLCFSSADSVGGEKRLISLKNDEGMEQLWLAKAPEGSHFIGQNAKLYGGVSSHFREVPRFCLLSDPRRNPGSGLGYETFEKLEKLELSNAECYPIQVRNLVSPSVSGFSVMGLQSRQLPWRVIKAMWDGDAMVIKGCKGNVAISDVYFENVEDGLGPQRGIDRWSLKNAYMRYIRDDAIENDHLINGEIENCLIDGCFVFLSHRPDDEFVSNSVTTIRNCLVRVQAQPHDGFDNREWRDQYIKIGDDGIGRSPGMLFKWSDRGGFVDARDCIFRVDAISASGPNDMDFPPGIYDNVTLIWLGSGPYPKPLPPGVTLTRDINVWQKARSQWISRLPTDHPAYSTLQISQTESHLPNQ